MFPHRYPALLRSQSACLGPRESVETFRRHCLKDTTRRLSTTCQELNVLQNIEPRLTRILDVFQVEFFGP